MGGNVTFGNEEAQCIDLRLTSRETVQKTLNNLFDSMNELFEEQFMNVLWKNEVHNHLSGSSSFLFNGMIDRESLLKNKPTFGDIDIQVDEKLRPNLLTFIESVFEKKIFIEGFTLLGFKPSVDQIITLWYSRDLHQNIQVDFELVEYTHDLPTAWSTFSRSAEWIDSSFGIKGVFHKFLIRSLTTSSLKAITVLCGKRKTPKLKTITNHAFSVHHGLRKKIKQLESGLFEEIPIEESTYTKDLQKIFHELFGFKPDVSDLYLFGSFSGIVWLIDKNFSHSEREKVVLGFAHTLWAPGAQILYRDNMLRDLEVKEVAFEYLISHVRSCYNDTILKWKQDFYDLSYQ